MSNHPSPLKQCPFCSENFNVTKNQDTIFNSCHKDNQESDLIKDNHTYIQSIIIATNELYKIKLRLESGENRHYLKVDYLRSKSQIWLGRNNTPGRVHIDEIIKFDITKPEELIKKIKLYVSLS